MKAIVATLFLITSFTSFAQFIGSSPQLKFNCKYSGSTSSLLISVEDVPTGYSTLKVVEAGGIREYSVYQNGCETMDCPKNLRNESGTIEFKQKGSKASGQIKGKKFSCSKL